ncbi:hypothetical protein [Streptosporangium subroseum]|uniref:hypothetical protein n=1 Tax=Streptosporangium subroseum TaxID=106412 RepID=UPI00308AA9C0|nr:hypothetical protein OHB15_18800 [Streptosporangium subroseum]
MQSVADQPPVEKFSQTPDTVIWSGLLPNFCVRFWAFNDANKSNHEAYGGGIRWPVFKLGELSDIFKMNEKSIRRASSTLEKAGFFKTTKTAKGLRYELFPVANVEDTYRGFENADRKVSPAGFAITPVSVITSNVSDGAFRFWQMGKRVAGGNEWTFGSQIRWAERLGVSERQVKNYVAELTNAELMEVRRRNNFGRNDYKMLDKPQSLVAAVSEPFSEPAAESILVGGVALSRYFHAALKTTYDGKMALKAYGAMNIPALASTFNRWMDDGAPAAYIKSVIDAYVAIEGFRTSGKAPWIDFLAKRALLAAHVARTASAADAATDDYNVDDWRSRGDLSHVSANDEYDINEWRSRESETDAGHTVADVVPDNVTQLRPKHSDPDTVDLSQNGADRMARYLSHQAK